MSLPETIKTAWPYLFGAFLLSFSFLMPGFLFALDMTFTPHLPFPTEVTHLFAFKSLLALANLVLAAEVIQKILLASIFFLSGWGAYRLLREMLPAHPLALHFAGILYMVNPFVYSRFMTGQYLVLLGYALLPFFAVAAWRFFQAPSGKRAVVMAAWLVVIAHVSIHTIGLAIVVAVAFGGLWAYRRWQHSTWRKAVGSYVLLATTAAVIACSYWLAPLLLGTGSTASTITGFGEADRTAFATTGEGLGVAGNIAALQGFWADAADLYLVPSDVFALWWLPIVLLWLLVGAGAWYGWQKQRGVTLVFACLAIVAGFLAAGTPFNNWLASWLPLFAGYREPQKFVALVVLSYAYFGALGTVAAGEYLQRKKALGKQRMQLVVAVLVLPLLCTPLMLGGFAGQLRPRDYPADWYGLNQKFQQQHTTDKVLFLPWHLYMRFNFAGRIVANPADKFFDPVVITSADPELKGAKSYGQTNEQRLINDEILPRARAGNTNMGKELHKQGVRYVILAKELDYQKYSFVSQQQDLRLLSDTKTLQVYEVIIDNYDR